ncbi:MAG: shikimate kinase [Anaerovoracaceae bacterium]
MEIYVTGFIGSDKMSKAKEIAKKENLEIFLLDEEIEKEDGRSAKRISMLMGEHGYRNAEYEILEKFDKKIDFILVCGDGVILDDMSREIIKRGKVLLADEELFLEMNAMKTSDGRNFNSKKLGNYEDKRQEANWFRNKKLRELWEKAKKDETLAYAFLNNLSEEDSFRKFIDIFNERKELYIECVTYNCVMKKD